MTIAELCERTSWLRPVLTWRPPNDVDQLQIGRVFRRDLIDPESGKSYRGKESSIFAVMGDWGGYVRGTGASFMRIKRLDGTEGWLRDLDYQGEAVVIRLA
jgi:hypothetical protein